jgi:hypothetical protein
MRLAQDGTQDLSIRMSMMLSDMAMELATINGRVDAIDVETRSLAKRGVPMLVFA